MFVLFFLIYLAIAAYEGVRNGLVHQLISLLIYVLAFIMAMIFYPALSDMLELIIPYPSPSWHNAFVLYDSTISFGLDQSFYALISFFLIFMLGWLISKLVLYVIEPADHFSQHPLMDMLGGALISIFQAYMILFLALFILSTMATDGIQEFFTHSGLARAIVQHTPLFSNFFYDGWILSYS